ncbi:feather keratin-like [Athene cunicularia]|uniref:feather keratin-like n=1 Tax=Athene cunicularia TaxID=194338 RepID=UPI000EF69D01|nr:feather keratin-like [Athene cunicularia]
MSCYDLCPPTSCGPTPLANSCNEPCVRQCQDSTYVIQPSPVVVTLPGPILSSFPQNTTVGSSASAAPIAESCNELCARQCPDSSAFIQPPPVVVTFPGPILSSFPQQAVVGSSGAPAFGGNLGLGGLYGAGATLGSGGLCTFGRPYASPACSPCALPRYSRKLWDTCGPC